MNVACDLALYRLLASNSEVKFIFFATAALKELAHMRKTYTYFFGWGHR